MAATALRTMALRRSPVLRPIAVPELAIWAGEKPILSPGRAIALAIEKQDRRRGRLEVYVKPTARHPRGAYMSGQLRDYPGHGAAAATCVHGLGEVVWSSPLNLIAANCERPPSYVSKRRLKASRPCCRRNPRVPLIITRLLTVGHSLEQERCRTTHWRLTVSDHRTR